MTHKQPTFECSNSSDLYTTGGSDKGNFALKYPIGLITADEIAYAGGVYGVVNSNYYLNTGISYWTMTPYNFSNYAYVLLTYSSGGIGSNKVDSTLGVRPVINLKADVQLVGSGTTSDPYVVVGAE